VHIDPYIVLGSAVVGFLVGMTGAGGGALMTPMLILLFGVKPSTAISSDLVAAVVMRPIGAAIHLGKGTVNLRLVGWMVLGSVPMAFLGAYLLSLLGDSSAAETNIEIALGAALLVGAAAMVLRYGLARRAGHTRGAVVHDLTVRPVPTVAIGMVGGVIVGMTSVGSGSLMIVLLLFLYPMLGANQLVGTDLTQAVPLTLAAALGALAFGHREDRRHHPVHRPRAVGLVAVRRRRGATTARRPSRRGRDRRHLAGRVGPANPGQHRGQAVDAHPCLRDLGGLRRQLLYGPAQRPVSSGHRAPGMQL
jgi:uncharacterized membrane protein YfcA